MDRKVKKILEAVASGVTCSGGGDIEDCPFCGAYGYGSGHYSTHDDDCVVVLARELLGKPSDHRHRTRGYLEAHPNEGQQP